MDFCPLRLLARQITQGFRHFWLLFGLLGPGPLAGCFDAEDPPRQGRRAVPRALSGSVPSGRPAAAATRGGSVKVERQERAMGTTLHFVAYTTPTTDEAQTRAAMDAAIAETLRLEALLSEWQQSSEIGRINARAGEWVTVGPETMTVLQKGVWAGAVSGGTFDITFQVLGGLWKFGGALEGEPSLPSPADVKRLRQLIDYRKVELDPTALRVRIPPQRAIGLGGIAKGYIVDRAAGVLSRAGLRAFLVRAGGDLYGAGRKPDGSSWVSGIQDPRGPQGTFFASLPLEDHAFSTAGDYARSFVLNGRRYHHILDPRTGYPATACRSVTVWAKDALTADIVDDAVFILGPERGLKLVESLDGVGVVIVDGRNRVWVSPRLRDKVTILKPPTDGL